MAPLIFLLMIVAPFLPLLQDLQSSVWHLSESAQGCRAAAGGGEERSEAVSYSDSDCLMGSRLCNQLFHASYVSGAFGTEWSVKYNQQEICALKGSTVFMNGSFTHPEGLTVNETFWTIDPVKGVKPTDLSKEPVYSGRVEFFTDEQKHFSLKLSDVMEKDEHQFCFRIKTNGGKERRTGAPGVQLRVTELRVEAPEEEVTEGKTADLTCKTTCSLTDPTFIWYKNGRPLTTKTIENNQLHLQTVSSEDAGSYSCAVRGSQHLRSTAHSLTVRYPPKSVSVSNSSSSEKMNLTCSSDGNPPVKNYTWFKEGGTSPVGSGLSYRPLQSGSYYCEARNEHGARRSDSVPVVTNKDNSVIVYGVVGVGLCGVAVFLAVFFWKRTRNKDDPDYANAGVSAPLSDNDSSSIEDYVNMTNRGLRAPPIDDDASSTQDYENMTKAGLRVPPPDDNSSSAHDYENMTKGGLRVKTPIGSFSSHDYENVPT
ncbi:hypothetical protein AOLI_G00234380 [Acnodon oligacanthus]